MMQARLFVGDKFLESLFRLPSHAQKKSVEFIDKFKNDPHRSSLNLESINTFKDPKLRTARIDQKYRAIIGSIDGRQDYYILWVDNHDEAMAWAQNKYFEWSDVTNAPQLFSLPDAPETEIPESTLPRQGTGTDPSASLVGGESSPESVPKSAPLSITELSQEQLLQLGVPEKLLVDVSHIDGLQRLEQLEHALPEDLFERLFSLLDGSSFEEVLAALEEEKKEGDAGETHAFARFYVEAKDELLAKMVHGDIEKWALFLHPSQRTVVEADYTGSANITGGAGTGKTVAAIHRLKHLSNRLQTPSDRILFATYTNALLANLEKQIAKLAPHRDRYKLSTIDKRAIELGTELGLIDANTTVLDYGNSVRSEHLWHKVLETHVSQFDAAFLSKEVNEVIHFHNLTDRMAYLNQTRYGRGKPITRKERLDIWKLYQSYQDLKRKQNMVDRLEMFNLVANHLNQHPSLRPYRHVILDEVQDCSTVEIRFIRSLAPEAPNDLFLVGDPFQAVYKRKLVFSHAGVNVRGRKSKRLKVNYRTTEEIKKYAVRALGSTVYYNFDEQQESMKGYVSLVHGAAPEYHVFKSLNEEMEHIASQVIELIETKSEKNSKTVPYSDIVIASRTVKSYKTALSHFHRLGLPHYEVKSKTGNKNGLHFCTFHSLKGLEYKIVFLMDVNDRTCPSLPPNYASMSPDEKKREEAAERSLLYTAMSRAIMKLVVTGTGGRSRLIG